MTATSVTRHSTYFERYNDDSLDPFQGDYGPVMATFRASVAREAATRATQLYEQVFTTSEVQPHVYLLLTSDISGAHVISVLHRPYRHVAPMGSAIAKLDVALMGDMRGMLPPTLVYFPEDGFQHLGNLLVPSAATLDQAFADDGALQSVGPYEDGDSGTETVATRSLVYLPPQYAPIALANPTMTPRKAWESIGGLIRTGDNAIAQTDAMQPLLDWLRVACTHADTDIADHRLLSEPPSYPHPPVPSLDLAVEARLRRDLPGLVPDSGPDTSTTRAINHLTDEMLRVNMDGVLRDQQAKTKDPSTYYGQGVVILMRITYATSIPLLPEVYHEVAKAPKRMERQAIEERLRCVADTLGLLDYVPAATAGLTKKISGCDFSHFDLADLEAGIHPFITTYRSPQSRTQLRNALSVYDDLREGTSATLHDFQALRESEKSGFPYSMMECTYCFKSFRVLLHTLLGDAHPLTNAWDNFVSLWIGREARLAEYLGPCQFALVLRWLQIRFSAWFTDQHREPVMISVPDFTGLLTKILYEESWMPTLPPRYQNHSFFPARVLGMGAPAPAPRAPRALTPAARRSATPTPIPPRRPASPAPAPAPSPAPAPAPGGAVQGRGARVNNSSFHASFTPFRQLGLSLIMVRDRAREANRPVPNNDDGTEFCLSYHVLGFCWENCRRTRDHRSHQTAEHARLVAWCTDCYREGGPL
jgi:hypothetical protein